MLAMVCVVRNVILRSVLWKMFVMYVVSLSMYVKLTHLHLTLANTCGSWWPHIQHTIEEKLRKDISSKYKTIDKKLRNLKLAQKETPQTQHAFHPSLVNYTEILFTNSEMGLLQKGLKYNIHAKRENWIQILALEAETAVTQLPPNDRRLQKTNSRTHR